jgi:hypothetical protein
MAKVHEAAEAIQKDYAVASNKQAKDPNNMDLINERKGYLQEMKNLKLAVDDYADGFGVWELGVQAKLYSKSAANIGNLGLNEQAYTEPVVWDRESKSLALPNSRGEDGKALLYKDVNLPFTDGKDAADVISAKAGELSAPRKNNLSDFQIKNNKKEIKSLILASNPAEAINNTPALLANREMLSLFPEWENIEYAVTMTDDQKEAVADEMANVVMSRYEFVAEAATGVTPQPRGFQETPTNQAWIRDAKELAKANVATEIQAPNGDYVVIIPKGVEFKGYAATEPYMRIVNGVDANGNPIYQLRPLEQGLIQTKKRK